MSHGGAVRPRGPLGAPQSPAPLPGGAGATAEVHGAGEPPPPRTRRPPRDRQGEPTDSEPRPPGLDRVGTPTQPCLASQAGTGGPGAPALTQRDDEKAHVAQPVGGLVGQLLHEEPQHRAEVVLRPGHGDLHGRRRLRVAVAAVAAGGTDGMDGTDASGSRRGQDRPAHPSRPRTEDG